MSMARIVRFYSRWRALFRHYTAVSAAPGFRERPEALVVAAANNLFASKAVPQALMIHAVIPTEYEEEALKEDMRRIAKSAEAQKMRIIGGHTEVSRDVSRPWYHMTGIGFTPASDDENILKPGQELIVTKRSRLQVRQRLHFRLRKSFQSVFRSLSSTGQRNLKN